MTHPRLHNETMSESDSNTGLQKEGMGPFVQMWALEVLLGRRGTTQVTECGKGP